MALKAAALYCVAAMAITIVFDLLGVVSLFLHHGIIFVVAMWVYAKVIRSPQGDELRVGTLFGITLVGSIAAAIIRAVVE